MTTADFVAVASANLALADASAYVRIARAEPGLTKPSVVRDANEGLGLLLGL